MYEAWKILNILIWSVICQRSNIKYICIRFDLAYHRLILDILKESIVLIRLNFIRYFINVILLTMPNVVAL